MSLASVAGRKVNESTEGADRGKSTQSAVWQWTGCQWRTWCDGLLDRHAESWLQNMKWRLRSDHTQLHPHMSTNIHTVVPWANSICSNKLLIMFMRKFQWYSTLMLTNQLNVSVPMILPWNQPVYTERLKLINLTETSPLYCILRRKSGQIALLVNIMCIWLPMLFPFFSWKSSNDNMWLVLVFCSGRLLGRFFENIFNKKSVK